MKTINKSFATPTPPASHDRAHGVQNAATTSCLYGTIRSVEPAHELLFLRRRQDGSEQIVYWLPQTRVLYHGEEVQPEVLRQGQEISVQLAGDAGRRFAQRINIVFEPSVTEPATVQRRSFWPSHSGKNGRR